MNKDLKEILELAKIDEEIDNIKDKIKNIPDETERRERELSDKKEELEKLTVKLDEITKERLSKEGQVDLHSTKIEQKKRQIFEVKSNKEYRLLSEEVEYLKGDVEAMEDRILEIMEKGEIIERDIEKLHNEVEKLVNENKLFVENSEKNEIVSKKRMTELEKMREELTTNMDRVLLDRYERTRERTNGRAIASVEDGICQGCFINLIPQVVSRVKLERTLERCPECARFLYFIEDENQS